MLASFVVLEIVGWLLVIAAWAKFGGTGPTQREFDD